MNRPQRYAVLADGTPCHAPLGDLLIDGDRVCCHVCGGWYLSVGAHLRVHGWTRSAYLEAFGLPRTCPLEGPATHARRAAALTRRQAREPEIRRAQTRARDRARNGDLARAAAHANRGRARALQTRRKAVATLESVDLAHRVERTRASARARLRRDADAAAHRLGFPDLRAYAQQRVPAGHSLADMSLELRFHKDWMHRQLPKLCPDLAALALTNESARRELTWQEPLLRLGFPDIASYLVQRHSTEGRTVHAMARETGLGRSTVTAALDAHGIAVEPHSGKRRAAAAREASVATALGVVDLRRWIDDRRGAGASWRDLVDETGQPESWLRRRLIA